MFVHFSYCLPNFQNLDNFFVETKKKHSCFKKLIHNYLDFQDFFEIPSFVIFAISNQQYDLAVEVFHLWMRFREDASRVTLIEESMDAEMSKLYDNLKNVLYDNLSVSEVGSPLLLQSIKALHLLDESNNSLSLALLVLEHRQKYWFAQQLTLESKIYPVLCKLSTDIQAASIDLKNILIDALNLTLRLVEGSISDVTFVLQLENNSDYTTEAFACLARCVDHADKWIMAVLDLELPSQAGRPSFPVINGLHPNHISILLEIAGNVYKQISSLLKSANPNYATRVCPCLLHWMLRTASQVAEQGLRTFASDIKNFSWSSLPPPPSAANLPDYQRRLVSYCPPLCALSNSIEVIIHACAPYLPSSSQSQLEDNDIARSSSSLPTMTQSQISTLLSNVASKGARLLVLSTKEVTSNRPELTASTSHVHDLFKTDFLNHIQEILEGYGFEKTLLNTQNAIRVLMTPA